MEYGDEKFIKKVHKMKRNINDSAYLGDLLVDSIFCFFKKQDVWKYDRKRMHRKSAMINEHGFRKDITLLKVL
jgi:glycerol-3-phosphate dehydrogenase (NAD(P)+)